MAENVKTSEPAVVPPLTEGGPPVPPKRSPGHRGADVKDTVAEMAAKAHEISLEAGSKMSAAMKDVVNAAAGLSGFVMESARDLVQFMVRRGQMTQEEADKLIRQVEEHQPKRPKAPPAPPAKPEPVRHAPVASHAPSHAAPSHAAPSHAPKTAAHHAPPPKKAASKPAKAAKPKKAAKPAKTAKATKPAKHAKKTAKSAPKKAAAKKPPPKKPAAKKSATKRK